MNGTFKEPDITDLVKSSVADIEEFEKSLIWQDFVRILKDWSVGLKQDYDNAEDIEEVRKLQGISITLEYVERLPEAMKSIASIAEEKTLRPKNDQRGGRNED